MYVATMQFLHKRHIPNKALTKKHNLLNFIKISSHLLKRSLMNN